jgi:hypothetical protein
MLRRSRRSVAKIRLLTAFLLIVDREEEGVGDPESKATGICDGSDGATSAGGGDTPRRLLDALLPLSQALHHPHVKDHASASRSRARSLPAALSAFRRRGSLCVNRPPGLALDGESVHLDLVLDLSNV